MVMFSTLFLKHQALTKTKEVALVGILSTATLLSQVMLSAIPNVELVTFLFLIYAIVFPLRTAVLIALVFSTMQALVWGFGDWVIGYYWIWTLWVLLVHLFKPLIKESVYGWAILSGVWGAIFGALFAINFGFFYGFTYSFAYWTRGVMFDLVHTVSNYLVTLVLFKPTYKAIQEVFRR